MFYYKIQLSRGLKPERPFDDFGDLLLSLYWTCFQFWEYAAFSPQNTSLSSMCLQESQFLLSSGYATSAIALSRRISPKNSVWVCSYSLNHQINNFQALTKKNKVSQEVETWYYNRILVSLFCCIYAQLIIS